MSSFLCLAKTMKWDGGNDLWQSTPATQAYFLMSAAFATAMHYIDVGSNTQEEQTVLLMGLGKFHTCGAIVGLNLNIKIMIHLVT